MPDFFDSSSDPVDLPHYVLEYDTYMLGEVILFLLIFTNV
jgi:hypothetical protein